MHPRAKYVQCRAGQACMHACRILRRVSESLACGAQHMALEAFAPGSASERTGCAFPALAIARAALTRLDAFPSAHRSKGCHRTCGVSTLVS